MNVKYLLNIQPDTPCTCTEVYLVVSSHSNKKGYSSQQCDVRKGKECLYLPVTEEAARPISGDIKIELKRTNFVRRTVSGKDLLYFIFLVL